MERKLVTQDELIAELEAMADSLKTPFSEFKALRKLYAITVVGANKAEFPDDAFFRSRGWQFTQKGSDRDETFPYYRDLMLEPIDPDMCWTSDVEGSVFHATDASNVAAIQSKGLLVHNGRTTFTKRSYTPPRVHLATTMDFAIQFSRSVDGRSLVKKDWRVIEFRVPEGVVFRPDPLLNPGGVWATEGIPADHIVTVHDLMDAISKQ